MYTDTEIILRGRKLKKFIEHAFDGIRKKSGLRQVEIEILLYLDSRPHAYSNEICRSLCINKGYVSQALDKLCRNGFVESVQDKDDRRYVAYTVTDSGKAVVEESAVIRDSLIKHLFEGITAEELEAMRKISTKLCDNIDRISME